MEFEEVIAALDKKEQTLLMVQSPTQVQFATVDSDTEMAKLAHNLKVLGTLKRMAGEKAVAYEKDYRYQTMLKAELFTKDVLEKLGIVKSNKFQYIKACLYEEQAKMETMKIKAKYFGDMYETYVEWINMYKKTRDIPYEG